MTDHPHLIPMLNGSAPSSGDRLNGWKEIAAHFNRGVRTVQRWEKLLGLPVHRFATGRGEVVYALRSELDAWRELVERRDSSVLRNGAEPHDDAPEGPGERDPVGGDRGVEARGAEMRRSGGAPRLSRVVVGVAAVAAVLVVAASVLLWRWWSQDPFRAEVRDGVLHVYGADGAQLWTHRFDAPLDDRFYDRSRLTSRRTIEVVDLDGDGRAEVVLAVSSHSSRRPGVYCFSNRGAIRFFREVRKTVSFGGETFAGPWEPITLAVTAADSGSPGIWISFSHQDLFPTMVEKLDASGAVIGAFWNAGTIEVLQPARLEGRPVMLAGGSYNEGRGGCLAALDERDPTGTAPNALPGFTCSGCPSRPPLRYFVFPAPDVTTAVRGSAAGIVSIRVGTDGSVTVLQLADASVAVRVSSGHIYYEFAPDLRPRRAEMQTTYGVLHDALHRAGLLDHKLGARDLGALWPVKSFNGRGFDLLYGTSDPAPGPVSEMPEKVAEK